MRKLLYIFIFLFLSFSFDADSPPPPSGWYQQFLPDVNNMPISDIDFLDSLVGFAVTGDGTVGDTNFILKTTNGGDNWFISFLNYRNFERVIFINDSIGYVCGGLNDVMGALYKTTNAGENWTRLNTPFGINYEDMSVLNDDTIWVVDDSGFNGGVFRTTNDGQNWTQQFSGGSQNPDKIYMYNGKMGFFSDGLTHQVLYKTTNSGSNWNTVPRENGFLDMHFIDSLTGWKLKGEVKKLKGEVKKSTDGGSTWVKQQMPINTNFYSGGEGLMTKFKFVNKDTIWGVYESYWYGPGNSRGIIWKTTNGGLNWGYQIPDTSIHIFRYDQIDFINKLNGCLFIIIHKQVYTLLLVEVIQHST